MRLITTIIVLLFLTFIPTKFLIAGGSIEIIETDTNDRQLVGFFDLRERESFLQLTNTDSAAQTIHIQLFNVDDNCNENNFFDTYTNNDTHVYNIRNIETNDGNPSGVSLPEGAYGIFVATYIDDVDPISPPFALIGNLRILDENGYEYRTNLQGSRGGQVDNREEFIFNFNTVGGVTLSDVIAIALSNVRDFESPAEVFAADVVNIWVAFDVNIYNINEVPFSCRNVIFSCVDQDNPLLEALLEESGDANVASFEYGINDAIPHSKGGELLCPGNNISEGFVRIEQLNEGSDTDIIYFTFAGLNNGNGRGSIDAMWNQSCAVDNSC